MSEVKTRALGEEENTNSQNETPEESDPQGNSPGRRAVHTLCAKVDTIGHENAECHEKLVRATWSVGEAWGTR